MKKGVVIFAVVILTACSSSKNNINTSNNKTVAEVNPELVYAQAKVPGITIKELTDGKKLYIERCSNCHALKNPADYTSQQWESILVRMTMRAHIYDEAQKLLIRNYLVAHSK